jgi:hypothetical protein
MNTTIKEKVLQESQINGSKGEKIKASRNINDNRTDNRLELRKKGS